TATLTATATHTLTPSDTPTPSATPTLEEPVLVVTAVMDDVSLDQNTAINNQQSTITLAEQVLPDGTSAPPSAYGWKTYESDHPAVVYEGAWTKITSRQASRGQYHYSVEPGAAIRFEFEGTAVRIRYVAFSNGGHWQLWIDGDLISDFGN